eukprot:338101-Pyramimonas_sp.AAC.1
MRTPREADGRLGTHTSSTTLFREHLGTVHCSMPEVWFSFRGDRTTATMRRYRRWSSQPWVTIGVQPSQDGAYTDNGPKMGLARNDVGVWLWMP